MTVNVESRDDEARSVECKGTYASGCSSSDLHAHTCQKGREYILKDCEASVC